MAQRRCPPTLVAAGSTSLALAIALVLAPLSRAATLPLAYSWLAQSAPAGSFPPLSAVPADTRLNINGSSSMALINQALKQRFEAQFPGAQVTLNQGDSTAALQSVRDGSLDLAAIGRSLTPAEKNQGLVAVPIARHRIALIVGPENPFRGSLTIEQFAQIFRGEVTNWSELGGPDAPIRLIDRPDSSDTRQALQTYDVFQAAPFTTGSTAVKLTEDSTEAVVQALGTDGLGYAIADQVLNQPNVQVLDMYGTLPSDPSYPFSQQLSYVYKGPSPSPAVQAFLGFATASENQAVVETAREEAAQQGATGGATQVPANAGAPTGGETTGSAPTPVPGAGGAGTGTGSSAAAPGGTTAGTGEGTAAPQAQPGFPWWWWLVIPATALVLWVLLRGGGGAADLEEEDLTEEDNLDAAAVPSVQSNGSSGGGTAGVTEPLPFATVGLAGLAAGAAVGTTTRAPARRQLSLVPHDHQTAHAYWDIPDSQHREARQQGGTQLAIRLYEVVQGNGRPTLRGVKQFNCNERDRDRRLSISLDDRNYLVELGYVTPTGGWLRLARSNEIHVPAHPLSQADPPAVTTSGIPTAPGRLTDAMQSLAATAGTIAAAPVTRGPMSQESRIILVPRNSHDAYVYWEIVAQDQAALQQQGGQKMLLRIYDVTDVDLSYEEPERFQQFECMESDRDREITVPASDRDYVAEVGYLTGNNRWLKLTRSAPVTFLATAEGQN